jgi:hypothetical protein
LSSLQAQPSYFPEKQLYPVVSGRTRMCVISAGIVVARLNPSEIAPTFFIIINFTRSISG